ncbi:pilus assembly protein PilP [Polaromonas sp. YR568]|uniref:pilus assembly protein PilP n=1 Tax=Polaromonas sp. YR568 TaxID=1855301 RepID=UPI00398BC318
MRTANSRATQALTFKDPFARVLLLGALALLPAIHVAAQGAAEEARYPALYQVAQELDRVAQQLPAPGALKKAGLSEGGFSFESGAADAAALAGRLTPDAGHWLGPYTVKPLPGSAEAEFQARIQHGLAVPLPTPSQPRLGDTYTLRLQEYAFQQGMRFDIFKADPVGSLNSGLFRVRFKISAPYKQMLDFLVNAPVLSEALVERISFVKGNAASVTAEGWVYLGDLVLEQAQAAGYRQQLAKARQSALGSRNPFTGTDTAQGRREPLESALLADLAVVGVMGQGSEKFALVMHKKPPAQLYRVRVGNYLGPERGRIVSITDQEVVIVEQAQGPDGKNTERRSVLAVPLPGRPPWER